MCVCFVCCFVCGLCAFMCCVLLCVVCVAVCFCVFCLRAVCVFCALRRFVCDCVYYLCLGLSYTQTFPLYLYRSHFGSRYKSGCCGHAGLLPSLAGCWQGARAPACALSALGWGTARKTFSVLPAFGMCVGACCGRGWAPVAGCVGCACVCILGGGRPPGKTSGCCQLLPVGACCGRAWAPVAGCVGWRRCMGSRGLEALHGDRKSVV